ncbi:hypothetical protein GCM10008969_07300 [Pseudomonas veronii subsp. inensis]
MLAKIVNDDACNQDARGALRFFASKLAPTERQPLSLDRRGRVLRTDVAGFHHGVELLRIATLLTRTIG